MVWRRKQIFPSEVEDRPTIDWSTWAQQERERAQALGAQEGSLYRPSVWLPRDMVARCDNIAAAFGMTRTEFVVAAIEHYQRHWRPCPPPPPPFPGGPS